jgi:hypothetical protein
VAVDTGNKPIRSQILWLWLQETTEIRLKMLWLWLQQTTQIRVKFCGCGYRKQPKYDSNAVAVATVLRLPCDVQ